MTDPGDKWVEWQRDHAAALGALQEAQRAYHRVFVERALASRRQSAADGPQATADGQQSAVSRPQSAVESALSESLKAVDAARMRLDDVRARKPE